MSTSYAPQTSVPAPSTAGDKSAPASGPAPAGTGYDAQAASLKPGASSYDAQAAALSPNLQLKPAAEDSTDQRRELVWRLREATSDAERYEILQGAAALGVVGVVEESVDLGDQARVSTVTGELFITGVGQIEAGYSAQEVISDDVSRTSRSAALKYTSEQGLEGEVSVERSLTGAEGHELTTTQRAALADGQATVGAGERATWVDEDGTKHTTHQSGEVGYGKKGASVAFSGEQSREHELGSDTQSARLSYDQTDGLDAEVSQVSVVSAVEGESITSTRQLSHKSGETSALASDEAVYTRDDGTRVTESQSAAFGHGKDGVSASVGTERATELEFDGQTVSTASGRSLSYSQGTATAAGHTATTVVEGDDKKSSQAQGQLSVSNAGAIEGGFSGSEVIEDGVSTRKKSADLSYTAQDGLKASVASERTLEAVEDHAITDKRSLSLEGGQATAALSQDTRYVTEDGTQVANNHSVAVGVGSNGLTGQVGAGDSVNDGITTTDRNAHVGMGSDGFTAGASHKKTVSAVEGEAMSTTTGASYSGGNATFSRSEDANWTDDDGAAHTTGGSSTLSVGQDGVQVGRQHTTSVKAADGTSSETGAGVTANLSEGQLGGNVSTAQRDAEGQKTGGAHAAGTIDVSADGRLEGVSGEVGVERKGVSVVVKGGYKYTIDPPKPSGDTWVVTLTVSQSAGGKAGGGKGVEGSLEGSVSDTRREVRHFNTRAEADAFHASGPSADEIGPAVTAEDALKMAQGDSASHSEATSVGVGAKGSVGGVTVGASLKIGDSQSVTITRAEGGVVEVLVTDTSMLGGGATIGAALIELGYSGESSSAHSVKVAFDLNTSAGKTAFEGFRGTGLVPRSGCTLLAVSDSATSKDEVTVGLGGAAYSHGSTVTDTVTVTGDGHRVEESQGTESLGASMPLVGTYSTTHGINISQTDDGTQVYNTTATVNASDAHDSSQALGRALNHEANPGASGAGSGTWVVNSSFTHDQMLALTQAIKAGRFNSASLIHHAGYGRSFEAAMKEANGNPDRMRPAITAFVSAVGDRALDLIRDTIGGSFNYDYSLQGDKYLKGAAGTAEHRTLMSGLQKRLDGAGSKSVLVKDVDKAIRAERERHDHLADGTNYPDLPRQLRAEEMTVSQDRIAELDKLKRQALAKVEAERYAPPQAEEPQVSDPDVISSELPSEEPQVCEVDPETDRAYAMWDDAIGTRDRLDARRSSWDTSYYEARQSEWVHGGAYASVVAREDLGPGIIFDGDHAQDYQLIDGYLSQGRSLWKQAQTAERDARSALDSLESELACGGDPKRIQTQLAAAQRKLAQAMEKYDRAASYFRMARSRYKDIERQNTDKPGYWVGYSKTMPAGQGL